MLKIVAICQNPINLRKRLTQKLIAMPIDMRARYPLELISLTPTHVKSYRFSLIVREIVI